MNKMKLGLAAVVALLGVSAVFAAKHARTTTLTYGIQSQTAAGQYWNVTKFNFATHTCTVASSTCALILNTLATNITVIRKNDPRILGKIPGAYVPR